MTTAKDKEEATATGLPATAGGPPTKTFADTLPSNIPKVKENVKVGGGKGPEIEDFEGEFIRKSDGEKYAVAIVVDNALDRTHHAQNSLHYWEGTVADFRKGFTMSNGDEITDKNDPGFKTEKEIEKDAKK